MWRSRNAPLRATQSTGRATRTTLQQGRFDIRIADASAHALRRSFRLADVKGDEKSDHDLKRLIEAADRAITAENFNALLENEAHGHHGRRGQRRPVFG